MPHLRLGLVLHNHQPVGNYDFVVEQVYREAYEPMLAALERHPAVRVAIHNSGCLFDWMERWRPEYIDRLRTLCDRGQVEMVGGGYYEPILPMIPDADKVGQVRKLARYIEQRLGQRPKGLWLTERVWEPGLPAPLADAGVEWTLVDDAHFRMVGLRDDELDGYYVTEDQGKRVKLFAGSQRLRYTIPWLDVPDLIDELRRLAASSAREAPYIVLGDDGEKFGAWPTTYAHVWEKGWIERFFSALEQEADWLELMPPGEYARRFEGRGLTYLPAASYAEMMEWSMPAEASARFHRVASEADARGRGDLLEFLRGGFWRYFLAKYPEANAMHKRGLRIDAKLAATSSTAARDALWQGQCNCPYWHGVFGGLYLRHVRAATLANLVRAERLADKAARKSGVHVRQEDLDYDGHVELLLQTPDLSLMLHPKAGGMLSELDLRRRDRALLDVIARRREAYHVALADGTAERAKQDVTNIHGDVRVKEEGLERALVFDRYRRGGLQEWILADDATPERFASGAAAPSFEPDGEWRCEVSRAEGGAVAHLTREAGGWHIAKQLEVPARGERVTVTYECTNATDEHRSARFVSEWNLQPPQCEGGDDRIARLEAGESTIDLRGGAGALPGLRSFVVRGSAPYGLRCEVDAEADAWHFPVESISSSEGGLERVWQGASVSLVAPIELAPGETRRLTLTWRTVDVAPVA